jgi:phage gpG-like protein
MARRYDAKSFGEMLRTVVDLISGREPKDKTKADLLHRIGNFLANEMDGLRNSIQHKVDGNEVRAGSFGVRYARFHEFGANLSPRAVRAMFANMSKHPRRASKGVFVSTGGGAGRLKPRPFIRPAFRNRANQARIRAMVRDWAFKI